MQSYYVEENGGSHVTIITNIHKERLMELEMHELRAREAVYKQLVSNSCDPVITFDADHGTIVTVNRAAEKAFQYPAAELIGKSLSVLLPQVSLLSTSLSLLFFFSPAPLLLYS